MKTVTPTGVYALIESRPGHRYFGLPRYIGQSKNMHKRWYSHKHCAKRGKAGSNLYLSRIINKHIEQQIDLCWKPLIICEEKDLDYYEIGLIKVYKDTLVNNSEGGKRADAVKGGHSVINRKLDPDLLEHQKLATLAAVKSGACRKNFQLAAIANSERALISYRNSLIKAGFSENYQPTFKEAKQYKFKYYFGKACEKHLELQGKRNISQSRCVSCANENRYVNLKGDKND